MVVYLVGSGPGDVELLTLKAFRLIKEADVMVYDNLVNRKILDYVKPSCKLIYVGKESGRHHKTQDEINEILVDHGSGFDVVVRLKGGDPYVFGRGGEEAEVLHARGIRFEVVPGISSALAVPMYAGIPLTHRDYNHSFAVLTGHRAAGRPKINWEKLPDVLVILMGVANIRSIVEALTAAGYPGDTPVAGIYEGTTFSQRVLRTTLGELPSQELKRPMIFVVGSVVELSGKLNWFREKIGMLRGKKIAVTRELSADAKEILEGLDADVIEMPLLELKDVDFELPDLGSFDVIVFTSVNGVRVVADRVDLSRYADKAFYAIGPKTRDILSRFGIRANIPVRYNSRVLGELMLKSNPSPKRMLLLRSGSASPILKEMLSEKHDVKEVSVYDVAVKEPDSDRLGAAKIVFITSSSAAGVYCRYHEKYCKKRAQLVVSIGPMTSETLRENGVSNYIESEESTVEGMIDSVIEYLWRNVG